ncbi:MAG: hypothetical protein OEV62_02435 [Actinomycetota bacterium]|nr:hypothetical protein [Actinomycetota bacterium]MDH4352747.1 hypothetical protein [Actinomycetota bacterium]MDH5278814.1 hypothetical protein [Actinomycetota bacterium]
MTLFRRSSRGRHAGPRTVRPAVPTFPEATATTPVAEPTVRGLVRIVFRDGSAMALDPHDPRAVPFRTLADSMWTRPRGTPGPAPSEPGESGQE